MKKADLNKIEKAVRELFADNETRLDEARRNGSEGRAYLDGKSQAFEDVIVLLNQMKRTA